MDILYHPRKVNVSNALSQRSMGILSYLGVENNELVREIHHLSKLGVRLLEAEDSGVKVQGTVVSSLIVEVKSRQQENPNIDNLIAKAQDRYSLAFYIARDGVLRYSSRLCVPNVVGTLI